MIEESAKLKEIIGVEGNLSKSSDIPILTKNTR